MISCNIDHVIQSGMESRCAMCSPFVRTKCGYDWREPGFLARS